jgi:hypothetical protein
VIAITSWTNRKTLYATQAAGSSTAVSSERNTIETVFCSDETYSTCRFSAGGDGGGELHCEGAARCEGERRQPLAA